MKKIIILAMALILSLGLNGCVDEIPTMEQETEIIEESVVYESEDEIDEKLVFELVAGEQGEYGDLNTLNAGTEFEETQYVYHIPAGTYRVTNIGEYMSQISVYSDETHITEEGWEEPAETIFVAVLDVNGSKEFTIADNQYIEIHEPAKFKIEEQ